MPRFPSDEWMDEFCERLRSQPDVHEIAAGLDGVYRFVVEAGGPLASTRSYDIQIRPAGDDVLISRLDTATDRPRLAMTASYERWQQLILGKLDVGMALMLRRLKVAGDLSGLMRDVNTTKPLLKALGEVDSLWLES